MEKYVRKYYCGPAWAPEYILKIFSHKFNHSCQLHDIAYTFKQETRLQTDLDFYHNMVEQTDGSIFWNFIAVIYFMIARIGGRFSW